MHFAGWRPSLVVLRYREVWGEDAEGELGGFSRYFYQMSIRRGPKLMGNEFLMTLEVYMELKRISMSGSERNPYLSLANLP